MYSTRSPGWAGLALRFGSTAKVLAKCKLKYYRISEWLGFALICLDWLCLNFALHLVFEAQIVQPKGLSPVPACVLGVNVPSTSLAPPQPDPLVLCLITWPFSQGRFLAWIEYGWNIHGASDFWIVEFP